MSQPAKSSLHPLTRGANESRLLGLFFSALRFMVAVIFKSLHGALSAPRGVSSNRAVASISLYLIGRAWSWASDLAHRGRRRLHPHFAHWRVRGLINKDRRSHLLRSSSGDPRVVVKIAHTHFQKGYRSRNNHRAERLNPIKRSTIGDIHGGQ
jgi:hypothetical protein